MYSSQKGISNSSVLANLRLNTAVTSSKLGTDVALVGATFTFAAINRTVTSPSLYVCSTLLTATYAYINALNSILTDVTTTFFSAIQ